MAEFVTANGRALAVDWLRMKRLISGMADAGYLDLQYEAGRTFTAAETFRIALVTVSRSPTCS